VLSIILSVPIRAQYVKIGRSLKIMRNRPRIKESTVKWAELARRYISQQNNEFLEQAVQDAEKNNEQAIAAFLQAFADGDSPEIDRLAERLIPELRHAKRTEEGITVNLLYVDIRTGFAEIYVDYPFENQKQLKEAGFRACKEAIKLAEFLNDEACQALYWQIWATGLWHAQMFRQAGNFYAKSLRLYQKLAEREPHIFNQNVAATLLNLGNVQAVMKNPAAAERFYLEALQHFRKLARREPHIFDENLAKTLNNLGTAQGDLRKLTDAEKSFAEALAVSRKLARAEPDIFDHGVAQTLTNLGTLQRKMRKLEAAENSFNEALLFFRRLTDRKSLNFHHDIATTLNGLGTVQSEMSDHAGAERSYIEALRTFRELAAHEPIFIQDIAMTLNNLGAAQLNLRKFKEAESSYTEALQLRRKLAESEARIFKQDLAMSLINLGAVQGDMRKLAEAEKSYAEALRLYRRLVRQEPRIFERYLAMTLNGLGSIQSELGKLAYAEKSFTKALRIYENLAGLEPRNYKRYVAMTLGNIGNLQRKRRNPEAAEKLYEKALRIYKNLAKKEPHIFNQDVAQTLNGLGYLKLEENRLAEAGKNFESARHLIEDLRRIAVTIDDRSRMLQGNVNIYSNLLVCYIRMQSWEKVLEIAESGKSRALSDLLNLKVEDLQPKPPTSDKLPLVKTLGQKYSDIIRKLQQIESYEKYLGEQSAQGDDDPDAAFSQTAAEKALERERRKAQDERFTAQSELQSVLDEINEYDKDFPPAAQNINAGIIFDISQKQNRTLVIFRVLRQFTALIFVFPNRRLHVEIVQNLNSDDLFKLFYDDWLIPYYEWKLSHRVPDLKEAFRENSPPVETGDWLLLMQQTLDKLYEKLMIHVRRILHEKSPTREILLIPSQSLAVLPLHAASWKDESGKKRYLLEEFTISYCPSVSVFKRCQENEKRRNEKTLIVTNPTSDLRFSEKEVRFIRKIHRSSENLPGKKATKSAVIKALAQDYGFVHFACHGLYNLGNQFDSGLLMADDVIKLSEIINCNLRNNWLTTLSACETGIADFDSPTDEHFGLPLGFIFAGSPSIWASLWSVSDETTSFLMQKAYENLNKKEFRNNKPGALRQSQLSIREMFSHPYYWAGFQHFGI
jgi:CHAT domain-containing protein